MKDIVIIGAGGVGRETSMLIEDINQVKRQWNILGYIDDDENLSGKLIHGYKVIGSTDWLNRVNKEIYVVCTVSNPEVKKRIISRLKNSNIRYATLIHPTAVLSRYVNIAEDVIVQAYCVIITNVTIGNHVQLNPQCGIGHDSIIGDYSSLYWNVNISGNVRVGIGCTLGTKTTVLQGRSIGDWAITGSCSNIVCDIPANCTAVGNPAKPIKFHEEIQI